MVGRLPALFLCLLLAPACRCESRSAPSRLLITATIEGETMSEATLQRLSAFPTADLADQFYTRPVVLWSRSGLAAAYLLRTEPDATARTSRQTFEPIFGEARVIRYQATLPREVEEEAALNLVDTDRMVAADVNGDGVDELILPRGLGAVDVHAIHGKLFDFPAPCPDYTLGYYEPRSTLVAKLADRAAVYFLMSRSLAVEDADRADEARLKALARHGLKDRHALLRVDGQGIARVFLLGLPPPGVEILAVGAINRPGSDKIDELLALYEDPDDRKVYLSRHLPTGQLIDKPRKLYVELSGATTGDFEFLPQSEVAVFKDTQQGLYFITPGKEANWIRRVELAALGDSYDIRFLRTTDCGTDPKTIIAVRDKLYAVSQAGELFTLETGAWKAVKEPRPFYQVKKESPEHQLVSILPSRTAPERFLVVQTRPRQARKLSREEIREAAGEFLSEETLSIARSLMKPELPGEMPMKDQALEARMEEERVRRGLPSLPRTVEEWKTQLPESYASEVKSLEDDYYSSLQFDLLRPVKDDEPLSQDKFEEDYRNDNRYLQWLGQQTIDSETVLSVVTRAAPTLVARFPDHLWSLDGNPVFGPRVEWLTTGRDLQAVLVLEHATTHDKNVAVFLVMGR